MKIYEIVSEACKILKDFNTPQLDAEVILSNLLKKDRVYLYVNREEILNTEIVDEFFKLIERREKGEPVQYIVGEQEFMSLPFRVKPGVLIPRGDTEILVEEVLKKISKMSAPKIVDVGCGSGAIAISLAKYKSDAFVYALDKMDIPLEVTALNAEENSVINRLEIIKSDLLASLDKELEGKLDVIVSNPPYIRDEVIPTLMKEVRDYEPHTALSGGEDGLSFYRELTKQAYGFLREGGYLAYEIGYDQREAVCKLLEENGFASVYTLKDLAGNDRVVAGWR